MFSKSFFSQTCMPLDMSFQMQKKISPMYGWRPAFGPRHMTAQPNFWSGPQRRYFPSARKVERRKKISHWRRRPEQRGEGRPCERRRRRFGPPLLFQPCWAPPFLDPVPSSRPQLTIFGSLKVWFCSGLLVPDQFVLWSGSFLRASATEVENTPA